MKSAKNQRLVLKSCISGINSFICPKRHYCNLFSVNIVNRLHDWIEKHTHVIQYPNIWDSIFVKVNGTLVKEQKDLLQISVLDMHNDLILPVSQGGVFGTINEYGKYVL